MRATIVRLKRFAGTCAKHDQPCLACNLWLGAESPQLTRRVMGESELVIEHLDVMRGGDLPCPWCGIGRGRAPVQLLDFPAAEKTGAFEGGQLDVSEFSQTRGEKIHTVRAEVDR